MPLEDRRQMRGVVEAGQDAAHGAVAVEHQQGDLADPVPRGECPSFLGHQAGDPELQPVFAERAGGLPRLQPQPVAGRVVDLHDGGYAIADCGEIGFPGLGGDGIEGIPAAAGKGDGAAGIDRRIDQEVAPAAAAPGRASGSCCSGPTFHCSRRRLFRVSRFPVPAFHRPLPIRLRGQPPEGCRAGPRTASHMRVRRRAVCSGIRRPVSAWGHPVAVAQGRMAPMQGWHLLAAGRPPRVDAEGHRVRGTPGRRARAESAAPQDWDPGEEP